MKLSESVLRKIVKEELETVLFEAEAGSKKDIEDWKAEIKKRGEGRKARSEFYNLADEEAGVPAPETENTETENKNKKKS